MSYLSPINYQCLLFEYRRPFMFFIGDRATFTFGNVKLFPRINNMAYFSSINYQCPLVEYRRSYAFLLAAGQPSPYVKYSIIKVRIYTKCIYPVFWKNVQYQIIAMNIVLVLNIPYSYSLGVNGNNSQHKFFNWKWVPHWWHRIHDIYIYICIWKWVVTV